MTEDGRAKGDFGTETSSRWFRKVVWPSFFNCRMSNKEGRDTLADCSGGSLLWSMVCGLWSVDLIRERLSFPRTIDHGRQTKNDENAVIG